MQIATRRCLLLGLAASPAAAWAEARPVAVASFSILADMTSRVADELFQVSSLVPPDTDAHGFQPTAADSRRLTGAAVLVENGFALEGWMTRLAEAADFRGRTAVASAGLTPRLVGSNREIDPHAWQDPRAGARYVRNIADCLAAARPESAALFRTNADTYEAEIGRLDTWIAAQLAPVPAARRRIVTTHDAFGWYGDRYGIAFLAAEGIDADAEPSAKGIAALVAQIRREQVHTVFLENMADPRVAQTLARETGARLSGPLYADALSRPDGPAPDYLALLRHNTTLFARAMAPE